MRRGRRVGLWSLALLVGFIAALGVPRAGYCDDEGEGRRRFKRGQDLYLKGKFLEAAEEFEAGYAAAPRPLFLLNIGHSYRRGGNLRKARDTYKTLLEMDPNIPQRAEVEGYLRSIDDALAISDVAPAHPRGGPSGHNPPSPPATSRLPQARPQDSSGQDGAPMPVFVESRAPQQTDSDSSDGVVSRPWFWITVAGIVVAGGVAAALLLKSDAKCPGDACFREMRMP